MLTWLPRTKRLGTGFWKKTDLEQHFSQYSLHKYLTTHVMTTAEFGRKSKKKWDYIFIDGDHSYQGVKHDYQLFWPRLRPGGIMGFHDVGITSKYQGKPFGVKKLWDEIKKPGKFSFSLDYGGSTIGFIQKPST